MTKKEIEQLKEIESLEKKYFLNILKALKENMGLLEDRLTFFNKNKRYWKDILKLDNLIAIGVQELVRCIIFRRFKSWKPFFLPVCSDTAFESNNAVINIDIKTVKEIDNDAKQGYIQVRPNQISYPNRSVKGIPWIPYQPTVIKGNKNRKLYSFSFFVKFIWSRKTSNEVDIKEIVLASVPNGLLAKKYGKDFIVNYKTYQFNELSEIKAISKKGKIIERWKSEGRTFVKLNDSTIWSKTKKPTKKFGRNWYKVINGGTARFNIKKISQPILTKGWNRIALIDS